MSDLIIRLVLDATVVLVCFEVGRLWERTITREGLEELAQKDPEVRYLINRIAAHRGSNQ